MKRSADSQLTRETLDDEDDNSTDDPREFQRASEKELAKRVIKPLPSRRGGSGSPAPQTGPKPSLPMPASSTTPPPASSNVSTGPTLASTSLPSLSGGFSFKPSAASGSPSPSNIPPIPPFKGTSSTVAASEVTGGFSFKFPTTKPKESTAGSAANGTKSSLPSFGGLPPFNPTPASSSSSAPTSTLSSKRAGGTKAPASAEAAPKSSFSFGLPTSNPPTATPSPPFPFAKPGATAKPSASASSNSKSNAAPPKKATPAPQNMTATAKSMSSIFSSMTSESPPRPSLPGFKAPNGGLAISPEKGTSSITSKGKPGSFSFGSGVPRKTVPAPVSKDTEMKSKTDDGKGKATTSTGRFGLGSSPVEDLTEEDEEQSETLPDGLDAGDFDPALNDDGTPLRKPHDHPDHQEAYEHDPELKYWMHLRGLNTSFMREIISMQREDPFTDLSVVFRSYKEFRRGVVGEMVAWLRANGKGDGTESPGEEESDSEDEEMYYEEGKPAEAELDMMDDDEPNDPTSIAERQFREQQERERLQPIDRDKTPPAGPQLPRAPVGGLYIFGGKPVSSFAGAATNGGGFTPTGAAAAFKPPPPATYTFERPGLKRPKTPLASAPATGFTPAPAKGDGMQGVKSTSPKPSPPSGMQGVKSTSPKPPQPTKSGFPPSGFTPSGSGFTPSATSIFGATLSNPSAPTGAGSGFTPSTITPFEFKPPSNPPGPTATTTSGFGSTLSSTPGFTFRPPPAKEPSPSAPKTPEVPPKSPTSTSASKSSTFPGFGPITGGPSGSLFGTKPAGGDKPAASVGSPFGGSTGGSSFGTGSAFGAFGTAGSAKDGVTVAAGIPSGDVVLAPFESVTSKPPSAFGSGADPAKAPLPFGNKPSSVWPASTPEASKPGGLFGTPPSTSGSGSIFGLVPSTGPSPFGSGGSIFGSKPTTGGSAPLVFGSASAFGSGGSSSAFGSGPTTASAPPNPAGDPSKRSDEVSSKSSDDKDQLEGDDENTTPKARPTSLPSDAPPPPTRTGIANPWAAAAPTSSLAPTAGGPFKFGMGSKPAVTEPESPAGGAAIKPAGFSFADPSPTFKLPSTGSFSFADPPKSSAGGFSFADPPKSTAGGAPAPFSNPFASPPKTGTLPGFSALSGGFGSSAFGSGAPPPVFGGGGQTTSGGTFSFGASSTLVPKGPFLSSTAGGASNTSSFGGGSAGASGSAPSDTAAAGASTGAGSSQDSDVAPEGGTGLTLGDDKFDQPGPGEEMEESMFTVRGKVMRFSEGIWIDMGIGQIRLYKHKETGAKRVFARNSKSGRILLNFAPFTKMEPKVDESKAKFMRMTAMDDGKLVKILVKLKEESEASQLVNVLQQEVEALS